MYTPFSQAELFKFFPASDPSRKRKFVKLQSRPLFPRNMGAKKQMLDFSKATLDNAIKTVKQPEQKEQKKPDNNIDTDGVLKGFLLAKSFKPTHNKLEDSEVERAQLAKAGKIYSKTRSFDSAQSYLDQKGVNYKIDRDLSNDEGLVVTTPEGKAEVSFRGTIANNFDDLKTDLNIFMGKESSDNQFKNAQDLFDKATEKYNSVEHVSGFSMGGSKAMRIGDFNNVETTVFNPFITPNNLLSSSKNFNPSESTTIVRTTGDPASLGLAVTNVGGNVRVKSVNSLKRGFLPFTEHDLSNFTDTISSRASENLFAVHVKNISNLAAKAAEYQLLDDNIESVNADKTFTEHLSKFNQGNNGRETTLDDMGNTVLTGKINKYSNLVRSWYDAKGGFTKAEINSIRNGTKAVHSDQFEPPTSDEYNNFVKDMKSVHAQPNDVGLSLEEREDYVRDPSIRQQKQDQAMKDLTHAQDSLNEHNEMTSTLDDSFAKPVRAMHAVSLFTGALSGILANKALGAIDPENKIPELPRVTTEGAMAGAIGSKISSSLGMETSLLPEAAAGAAGYAADYLVNKGVRGVEEKLGVQKGGDVEEASANIVGDAAGGAVAGGMLGGPAGAAIGGGLGGIIGAGSFLYHKFF